jgi:exosortase D (VPLPA-CTERM-specific)
MHLKETDIKYWILPLVVILLGFAWAYWPNLEILVKQWLRNDDFSHGLLIVPISIYLIWEKRGQLAAVDIRGDWRALPLMGVAVGLYIVGELGAELFTTRVAIISLLIGSIWLLYGYSVVRVIRFPLLFLFMMLPLPGFIYRNITFPLQLLSSFMSVGILQSLGITAYREGNVIDMGFSQFQVVEACNGLRFILPLLTLGVLFAFWWSKENVMWKRIVLILASIPIAILSNVIRIAGTGIVSMVWGTEAAQGFFHDFSGWAVFMLCFGFYALLNVGLRFLPGKPPQREDEATRTRPPARRKPQQAPGWQALAAAVAVIMATPSAVAHLGSVPPRPLEKPLQAFPMQYGDWRGRTSELDTQIWEQVGGQDYVQVDYRKAGDMPVNFYTAYYEYQRKAGDFVHSPKLCLPGAGWFIQADHVRELAIAEPPSIYDGRILFNEMVISKGGHRQLVYYWYQGRGRNFTNEYMAKFYMVWDGIFRRRTDGALVRLVRSIAPHETVDDARSVLDDFVIFTSRELEAFFPS